MSTATAKQPVKRKRKRISPLELVMARNAFYKNKHYTVTGICAGSILLNIAMALFIFRLHLLNHIDRVYFATSPEGELLREVPLNKPMRTKQELQKFAKDVAENVASFNYVNYRTIFQNAQQYLTDAGYDNYLKALEDSGNLATVIEGKFVASTKAAGEVVIKELPLPDRVAWTADVPVTTTYMNHTKTIVQPLTVHLVIGRVSLATADDGVLVAQIYIRDRKAAKKKKS